MDRARLAVPWILVGGALLRTLHYLANRSLWLDESMLALNIGRRSFAELAAPLDFNQAAPLGFLWLEKLAVTLLGLNELALRFWPFVAALLALAAFAALARRVLRTPGLLFAVTALALSTSLIYYGAEVKQYSFDVLLAALLLWLATDEPVRRTRWPLLSLAGALGVWFSHPLVFVLPGVAVFLWLRERSRAPGGARSGTRALAAACAAWILGFAASWFLTATDASASPLMARFWEEGFMPVPPTGLEDLRWFVDAFTGWIRTTLDFAETVDPLRAVAIAAGGVLAVSGAVSMARGDRALLLLVGLPVLAALGASALSLYPFRGRLLLFLVPSTLILMGRGFEAGIERFGRDPVGTIGYAGGALLLGGLYLLGSGGIAARWLANPEREELRPVLEHVAAAARPGDVVYLHSGARHTYLFYERACPACRIRAQTILPGRFLSGREDAIAAELDALPDRGRVWLIFQHLWWGVGELERARMLEALSRRAVSEEHVRETGASAHLFELVPATSAGARR